MEAVDREIAGGFPSLLFSPGLETLYESDVHLARERQFIRTTQLAMGLFISYLMTDYLMTPDVIEMAFIGRLGFFTPCLLVAWFVITRSPPRHVREGIACIVTILSVVETMTVLSFSRYPDLTVYQVGSVLIMVFATVVQRLQLRYAFAALVGIVIVQLGFVSRLSDMTSRLMVFTVVFFLTAAVLLLWAAYALERAERHAYLLNLRNRLLNERLDKTSKEDALTGLWNRRHLETVMSTAWATAADRPRDMSVILLDIDHFKTFNDAYGHLEGDKCLRRLADCVGETLAVDARASAVRFGGEEFLVFVDSGGSPAARLIAERIATAIKAAAIPHPVLGEGRIVTASLGIATGSAPDLSMNKLVAAADDALYRAKRGGRDRIVAVLVAPEPLQPLAVAPLRAAS